MVGSVDESYKDARCVMAGRAGNIRAVEEGEVPEPRKVPLTIEEAADVGDTLAELQAMRVLNARMMASPTIAGRDFAALSRRHLEIGREIDSLLAKARQEEEEGGVNNSPDEKWDAEAV